MSELTTNAGLASLLRSIKKLPKTASVADLEALLRPPRSEKFERARSLSGLVRMLDRDVYAFLVRDLKGPPVIQDLIDAYPQEFERISAGAWALRSELRDSILATWQSRQAEWRAQNTALFEQYFRKRSDKASQIEAVYHGAAGTDPKKVIDYFKERYKEADNQPDFAQCAAYLEAIHQQKDFRGPDVSSEYRDKARYLQARMLFLDALQKTNVYVERTAAHEALQQVFDRKVITTVTEQNVVRSVEAWIFHVHATGGLGKTMLLRWFLARNLVLRRVPCAWIDFDSYSLLEVVQFPLRLLQIVIRQWAQQMTQTALVKAADDLQRWKDEPGWNQEALANLRSQLDSGRTQEEMVIVLDTLEGPTLSQPEWMKECLAILRELHAYFPRLTMILSGRYDLTQLGSPTRPLFEKGEAVIYELPPFSRDEATSYLTQQKVIDGRMQAAILGRAVVAAPTTAILVGATEPAPTYNPFKVALLAELVLDRNDLRPEDVDTLPDVDIAYLIERVILRIPSQPLRWMIRYGAVPRGLTLPVLKDVLLPPLKGALRGSPDDLKASHLSDDVRKYLDSKVTWTPDPKLASKLDPVALWDELKTYARERGWISLGNDDSLQLHPEVVKPVKMLLRQEPIYGTLQAAVRDFYLRKWNLRRKSAVRPAQVAAEAIYHASEINPRSARELWQKVRADADPESAYVITTDAFGMSYRGVDDRPLYPAWFCEALVESARLKLHEAGTDFSPESEGGRVFVAHVQAAARIDPSAVPALFSSLVAPSDVDLVTRLEAQIRRGVQPYDLLWLHVRAARALDTVDPARAAKHWLSAIEAARGAGVPQITAGHIQAALAAQYVREERYSDAMRLYNLARKGGVNVEDILEKQTDLALTFRDVSRAEALIRDLVKRAPSRDVRERLFRLNILADATLQTLSASRRFMDVPLQMNTAARIQASLLEGELRNLLMDYAGALEEFANARDAGSAPGVDRETASPLGLREIEICAYDLGDPVAARSYLESLTNLGADLQMRSDRLQLVSAFIAAHTGDRPGASATLSSLATSPSRLTRARALLMGLALDLVKSPAKAVRNLLATLPTIDPPQRLADALGILEYIDAPSKALATAQQQIVKIVLKAIRGVADPQTEILLRLLDLAHIGSASKQQLRARVRQATDALPRRLTIGRVRHALRLIDHCERAGLKPPFSYQSLVEEATKAGLERTPLEGLVQARAALDWSRNGKHDTALKLLNEALARWKDQPPQGRFQQEIGRIRDTVNQAATPSHDAVEAVSPTPSMETAPAPSIEAARGLARIVLGANAATLLEGRFDKLASGPMTRVIVADWRSVQALLVGLLRDVAHGDPSPAVQLATAPLHASLPWEFAVPVLDSRLFCRTIVDGKAPLSFDRPQGSRRVLVIKAEETDDLSFAVSEAASSGFAIEHLYQEGQESGYVTPLVAPLSGDLNRTLREIRPAVVHIVGQLVESPSGVYVDLEGSDTRLFAQAETQPGKRLDASRIARYVESFAPLVILDVTRPENLTDAVRMLLLRNRFAAELMSSGYVRAVLACGLTPADERESLSRALVGGIGDNTSLAFLWSSIREDDDPTDLAELLSFSSPALFAHDPYQRVFGRGIEPNAPTEG
jgi:tetratricopeptide (TPR) repeat protein